MHLSHFRSKLYYSTQYNYNCIKYDFDSHVYMDTNNDNKILLKTKSVPIVTFAAHNAGSF